jgi:phosphatidylserine/phosphatidylglycerophosphate/cardiolipin synthase-like enzyme
MKSSIAIANNEIVFLAWRPPAERLDGCLGFAVERIDVATGQAKILPAGVGFAGDARSSAQGKTTADCPVQKFSWRDLSPPYGRTYRYRITPMVGTPGSLVPEPGQARLTDPVAVTDDCGGLRAFFNRGIVGTQATAKALPKSSGGGPDAEVLRARIGQVRDPLRERLSGFVPEAVQILLRRAQDEDGTCYCALYELSDPELAGALLAARRNVRIVLSNTGADDATNAASRQALHDAGADLRDRMLGSGHIGHNKFVVYVDAAGAARAVWTGSTNWTPTGLCAQTNSGVLIESGALAARYLDYWNRLAADTDAAELKSELQAAPFRTSNAGARSPIVLDGGSEVSAWFSPNTRQKTKPRTPATPPDLKEVFEVLDGARRGILFLAFIPGSPSIVDRVHDLALGDPDLFVRGALTDTATARGFATDLFHRDGREPDARVTPVAGVPDDFAFWQKELWKVGHAVIHDKIAVVDPMDDARCAVVLGSHNLGFRASYANDENLLVVRRCPALARAYAAHVQDVYDHYRWRATLGPKGKTKSGAKAFSGLDRTDRWQDKYLAADTSIAAEVRFWLDS